MVMEDLTVVSYNVHSCVGSDGKYSIDRVSNVLASQHPDIVCLQEIEVNNSRQHSQQQQPTPTPTPTQTRLWSHPHSHDQPATIAASLGWKEPHTAFSKAISSEIDGCLWFKSERHTDSSSSSSASGDFGIAILSRHKILDTREWSYPRYRTKTLRNAMACLVQLPSNSRDCIWIVNTHLGCHTGEEQYRQSLELAKFVRFLRGEKGGLNTAAAATATATGVILCGDLNSLPHFRSIQTLESVGLRDVWKECGVGYGCTFPAEGLVGPPLPWLCLPPVFRLDYIFTQCFEDEYEQGEDTVVLRPKDIHVVNQSADRGTHEIDLCSSDHLALCATFAVGRLNRIT